MGEDVKRKDRPGDQPLPKPADGPVMHDLVIEDLTGHPNLGAVPLAGMLRGRKLLGIERYGEPLRAFNGRDALRDACEEAADLLVYLKQAHREAQARHDSSDLILTKIYRATLELAAQLANLHLTRPR